ncbi:MAG TPA: M14 family metallopeptidase [Casimicrobiaceae bacterium]|nr:M14 family metallopeptidase [Casimicrobiaceae bacterium]
MIPITEAFSPTYAKAREKFVAAAAALRLPAERHVHPAARGAEGEELSVDVARLGNPDGDALLVLTSGMHGVEGFCGSGCQTALLHDEAILAAVEASGVGVLLHHAVNPYGFSHLHRTNEDNVDLNRNFRDFARPPARNAAYAEVHAMMVPAEWPPTPANGAAIAAYVAAQGRAALQSAVSSGQSDCPDGLFYAGVAPVWSNVVLRDVLHRHGAGRRKLGWIDFHTGLGPWGHGEKIYSGPADPVMIARAKAWYGADVTSFYDGSSTSPLLTGVSFHAALEACPEVEFTGIALEYGTLSLEATLQALRADQWLRNHPGTDAATRAAIKRQLRDAFHDEREEWKAMVYAQARVAVLQALRAMHE